MQKRTLYHVAALLAVLALVLSACGQTQAPAVTSAPAAETQATSGSTVVTLKIAVLPVLDATPMYVAQSAGLFEKNGVQVEFIPVGSAPERDQLIAAGQADGMINEILSTMFYNKDQVQVQTVRFARTATADSPIFRILAAKDSGITTPEQLKGVPVGVSQGTVIEYLTNRLLQAQGLTPEEIQVVAVPKIDDRMALLGSGQLKAGMLPDPVASLAMLQGATLVIDDSSHPEYSHSVYTFRKAVLDEHPDAVRGFLAAVEEAVQQINADAGKFKDLLRERKLVPEPLMESFQIPNFVTAGVPSQEQWDDVLAWAKEKGLLNQDVPYADSVNAGFLP